MHPPPPNVLRPWQLVTHMGTHIQHFQHFMRLEQKADDKDEDVEDGDEWQQSADVRWIPPQSCSNQTQQHDDSRLNHTTAKSF
jgi:hypothetical protein